MDETDKPKGPFEMDNLAEELMRQASEVAERARQSGPDAEWTPEDQAELNSELARIEFDPAHANPHMADRTVKVENQETPVHAYNNFPMILSVMDKVRHSEETPKALTFEATYAHVAQERRYLKIFDALESAYPAVYRRTKQLFENRGSPLKIRGRELTADGEIFIKSQAYSAAAKIARGLDPDYDLAYLYG